MGVVMEAALMLPTGEGVPLVVVGAPKKRTRANDAERSVDARKLDGGLGEDERRAMSRPRNVPMLRGGVRGAYGGKEDRTGGNIARLLTCI